MKETELKKSIKKLLTLALNCKFIINDKYECVVKNIRPFSIFYKDDNCPRYSSNIMVKVKDHNLLSKVEVAWNIDLENDLDCTLSFYDNNNVVSIIQVADIKFI